MHSYLVRVEAVNFESFILDTSDLSTIRGGGLLLLKPELDQFEQENQLRQPVTSGSSILHYEVTLPSDTDAAALCRAIEQHLASREPLAEASIFASFAPLEGDDQTSWQRAVAVTKTAIRWAQLQSPAVIYPHLNGTNQIDQIDGVRPASERPDFIKYSDTGQTGVPWVISDATYERRVHGVERKHKAYADRFKCPKDQQFVNDLNQLSTHPRKDILNQKLAVIYLDGNKFGDRFASAGREDFKKLSAQIQRNQDEFATWLLKLSAHDPENTMTSWHWSGTIRSNSGAVFPKDRAFRIETLLWGGDEIMWVVPAWCGWWMLASFFQHYGRFFPQMPGEPLTHAASIVFCHKNAPIHRITSLAKMLAGSAKVKDVNRNFMTYQVLESFDHLGANGEALRKNRLPPLFANVDPLLLSGDSMHQLATPLNHFRSRFPRSKLHRILHLYHQDPIEAAKLAGEELERNGATSNFQEITAALALPFTPDEPQRTAASWLHIAELWDYTPLPDWKDPQLPAEYVR